jgi:uncharacterized membrane protein
MSPSTRRMVVLVVVGAVTGSAFAIVGPWQLAVLLGWIAALLGYLGAVWLAIYRSDGDATERSSTVEDDSRALRGFLLLAACVISLVGVMLALHKASTVHGGAQPVLLTSAAVATVLLSWTAVHTDFTLRYAHLYYSAPVGGVDFAHDDHGDDRPDYRDFAYLAFTIGMTYQVSDTGLLTKQFRRVLLVHAFLSYLFGVVIIAAVINVIAGLVN